MALRIRRNGRIFCAAETLPEDGDTYIDDGLHYKLSSNKKVLVTDGGNEWWWRGSVPDGIKLTDYYLYED